MLVWFATLVTLADGLQRVGFLSWFAARVTAGLSPVPATTRLVLLVTVFFVAHYMFASLTAHATALLPAFLAAGVAMPDMPARPLALLLCYSIGLMGVLTPYATGPAPIYFGSGYVEPWRVLDARGSHRRLLPRGPARGSGCRGSSPSIP